MSNDKLEPGEPHPAAEHAKRWLAKQGVDLLLIQDSLASCAMDGSRLAQVCHGTLHRLLNGEPVSDRYLLGLCWFAFVMNKETEKLN